MIRRAFRTIFAATRTLATRAPLALLAAFGSACITAPVDALIWETVGGGRADQSAMLQVMLSWVVVYLAVAIAFGPLFAALAVYSARTAHTGSDWSVSGGVNFALNRYKRMFRPHARAQLAIQIGMQVLVPGIFYLCMYAFVDAIAATDEAAKSPTTKSKNLTRGRRGAVFWVALPFILLSVPKGLVIDPQALSLGLPAFIASHALSGLMEFWLAAGFAHLYFERVAELRAVDAAREAAAPTPAS